MSSLNRTLFCSVGCGGEQTHSVESCKTRAGHSPSHNPHSPAMGLSSSLPLKEQIRENKREINRAVRELDRERGKLERQEEQLKERIRKAAKESQMVRARGK